MSELLKQRAQAIRIDAIIVLSIDINEISRNGNQMFLPNMIMNLLRQLKDNAVLFRKSMKLSVAMNKLTVLESELLSVFAQKYQALNSHIEKLYVVERECTRVGQYVFFKYYEEEDILPISEDILSVDKIIITKGIDPGIGFVGNIADFKLHSLELFVYGSDEWDCTIQNFTLKDLKQL
ncbi:hypothetical protein ABTW24_14375 [Sphingobacterium thalpophilum]|uniref:Uncharacterized protein n=1 Tax=Sphingobacterium thalpophilum TaxID=259 RepID=A0ABV4HHV4_9SPHI